MNHRHYLKSFGLLTLSLLALTGCRMEEQGRIVNYEPGIYKGQPDTQLSQEQRRALRKRSLYPSSSSGTKNNDAAVSAPKITSVPRKIREPEARFDRSEARAILNSRIRFQKGSGI